MKRYYRPNPMFKAILNYINALQILYVWNTIKTKR